MHRNVRRTAGIAAVIAAASVIAVGCGDDDSTPSVDDLKASGQSAVESAKDKAGEATDSAKASGESAKPGTGNGDEASGETKIQTPNGEFAVGGPILAKYTEAGGQSSPLGLPTKAQEDAPNGGKYQDFTGGVIYWSEQTQAHVVWGEIRKAWESDGGPDGKLGYPVSDEKDIAGGKQSDFSGGQINWVNGQTQVVPK